LQFPNSFSSCGEGPVQYLLFLVLLHGGDPLHQGVEETVDIVFPMAYLGKLRFFEIMKSKKGREGVAQLFEGMCPNLTYPVQDLKQLKKQIKSEDTVKGNIDKKFMLDRISDASLSSGIFDTKKMFDALLPDSAAMLDEIGYISVLCSFDSDCRCQMCFAGSRCT